MSTPLHSRIAALVPSISGWCSVEKANDLALAVIKLRSSVTVEIGVFGGRSLLPMALAHAEQDHGGVWAIDPWQAAASVEGYDPVNAEWWSRVNHEALYQQFLGHLKAHGVEKFVKIVRGKSDNVTPPEVIDVLHLDGQHTDQTVRDVERFASRVRPDGFVFVDDIHWSGGGVERGVARLLTMGFTQIFVRDTGAMFQRAAAPREPSVTIKRLAKRLLKNKGAIETLSEEIRKPKKRGRPPGSKNKRK